MDAQRGRKFAAAANDWAARAIKANLALDALVRSAPSFIWGVWHDAKFIVDHIQKQQGYLAYQGSAERLPVEWSKK